MSVTNMYSWEYGIVSFIDILGFSSIVERDARKIEPEDLKRINEGLNEVREIYKDSGLNTILFSDSIIISTSLDNQSIINIIKNSIAIQKSLLSKKILTRGGIAFGKHYQDEKTSYSEALIKAYYLETQKAKFPRVIIDKDLIDWLKHDKDTSTVQKKEAQELLLKDKDGEIFLDYLSDENLEQSLEILTSASKQIKSANILEKYQWLDSYHNHKCQQDHQELACHAYSQGLSKSPL